MSQDIINEVYFLLGSILVGIFITFIYDLLLTARSIIRHSLFFVSLEDLLFWIACAIAGFYMLYEENNGILRWFAVCGAALGMLLYKKLIGNHFVNIMSKLIGKLLHIAHKVISFVLRPIRWFFGRLSLFFGFLLKKQKKSAKYAKKKLTAYIKMLKITLCKH